MIAIDVHEHPSENLEKDQYERRQNDDHE